MDGDRIIANFVDTSKTTMGSAQTNERFGVAPTEYPYNNLQRYADGGPLNLHTVVGTRERWTGLRQACDRKGILYLEWGIVERKVRLGQDVAIPLLKNHTFLCMDLGIAKEATVVAVVASVDPANGNVRIETSNRAFTSGARVNAIGAYEHVIARNREMLDERGNLAQMSQTHGRVVGSRRYDTFRGTLKNKGITLLQFRCNRELRRALGQIRNRKRSHWSAVANTLLAMVDAMEEFHDTPERRGAPIIVIGRPTFKSSMTGHQAAACQSFIDYLQRFFPVVLLDEYHTSKCCYRCRRPGLRDIPGEYRVRSCAHCREQDPDFRVDRDVSAGINLFQVFVSLISTGLRPPEYRRARQ